MDEGGESSSCHKVDHPAEAAHAPATPAKPGLPDLNMMSENWLKNPFDEAIFEETSVNKSFSCWEGNLGSTSQTHDMFSMDDVETWHRISCRDLLALADANIRRGSDEQCNSTEQYGQLNFLNHLTDLNLPPQFTRVTPDQATRAEHKQVASDVVVSNEDGVTKNLAAGNKERSNLDEQASGSTLVETNQNFEKGLTEQTTLNETPQPKERRRKHRPKVVTEGQRKRAKKSTTPTPKPVGSSTGKRKYVRRKGVEKPTATPVVEEANGTIDPMTDQQTKKSCRKKINFDEAEKGTKVMVEKTQVEHTVEVVETYQKTLESESPNPITPSKTELPQGRSKKVASKKAKCQINFLQETHDKGPSPNESNCSTSACFRKGEEAEGSSKNKIDGIELWGEKAIGIYRQSLEAYLSMYTDYNSCSKQGMHLPAIYRENRIETVFSVCSSAQNSANKAPDMPKGNDQQSYRCMQASGHLQISTKKRTESLAAVNDSGSFGGMMDGRHWQTPKGASIYEAHATDFQVSAATKKRTKKKAMVSSLYHDHQCFTNHKGCHPNLRCKSLYDIDALIYQFEQLDINSRMAEKGKDALIPYLSGYHEQNALVIYQRDGSLVPYEGLFNPMKKRKPRPKVDLDDETSRVWRLLLEDINSQGIDGTDEDKAKWWEEERKVFRGRADSFIARMHLVQGDRRFSQWKGSVLDSVIGVFLTQNVSDHLSSSAFMSLAARFPLKSSSSEPLDEEKPILSVEEPCQADEDKTISWHEEKSNQPSGDNGAIMLQDADSCEEKEVVNSNEFSKNSTCIVDLNDNSECEVPKVSEKDLAMYKESVVDQIEVDDIVSSQNSADTSPSSVQSSIPHTTERLGSCSMQNSEEEQKERSKATLLGGYTTFVELLHLQGRTMVHETHTQQQAEESSNRKIGQEGVEGMACSEGQNDGISPGSNNAELTLSPKEHELPNVCSLGALEVESFVLREERKIIQKKSEEECASEESGLSAESASQATVQMVQTISSQVAAKSCNTFQAGLQETSKATESNNIVEASGETVQKVVEFNLNDHGSRQIVNGMDEGSSKVKRGKTGKKQIKVDWDNLRLQAEVKQKREKTPNTIDSLDYEAVRSAHVDELADAIKERGMNNVLAARIKDLLDRLVRDHGSIDLEWLRDVPPDKAKEYLLSFRGLGLKSVECVRLLTLHHLAFPVDTNVGRIAVRLGWVPLQPLPESLQLHLLELYPVLESIQKYLWPRLCKLDQRTLYELHYQMITFGKVFCTKSKPNCNACPMRGECRHFASAFASARLALPAPEESISRLTENRTGQNPIGMLDQHQLTLPPASEQMQQLSKVLNCNPVIEEPASPGPIVEVPETPGPIVEVPATPEPEQIQQEEFDIEDYCEDAEEIPMIKLNIEEFTQNLQTYMERHMELGEGDMSKALVALTSEAASIPTPKLKNVSQLRTEHQVYELPDSHPLLERLDTREPDDPCSYLLAIWTPGETADSIQPPGGQCCSQESGTLCSEETCFFCNSTREANSQTVRGTLLIPCRTAMRGSFPLNGTYFQVNEVFADHESSLNPIDVPRSWLWNLPRRTVYFGTSIPTIFKGLTTEDIQYCFWRGFVCVRGFDQKTRAPRPLMARLHFPASKLKRSRAQTDEK